MSILRINRNILECKSVVSNSEDAEMQVLIETYWNVNENTVGAHATGCNVLIETYWNVNFFAGWNLLRHFEVLIETYWNVNVILILILPFSPSINRNILECKLM